MKKFKYLIISVAAILLAVLVTFVAVVLPNSTYSKEQQIVKKYVNYVNHGKLTKATKLTTDNAFSLDFSGGYVMDAYDLQDSIEHSYFYSILSAIPDDAMELKKIKLVGTSKYEPYEEMEEIGFYFEEGLAGGSLEAVIQVEYIDFDGKKNTVEKTYLMEFMKVGRKTYIFTY